MLALDTLRQLCVGRLPNRREGWSHCQEDKVRYSFIVASLAASYSENPLVLAWPANIDTATIMIQRGLPGQMGQKWAFKVMQNC